MDLSWKQSLLLLGLSPFFLPLRGMEMVMIAILGVVISGMGMGGERVLVRKRIKMMVLKGRGSKGNRSRYRPSSIQLEMKKQKWNMKWKKKETSEEREEGQTSALDSILLLAIEEALVRSLSMKKS